MPLHLESFLEQCWRVEIGIAMDLAIAEKVCVLKSWNETQHARLLAELQMVLKPDKVVRIGAQVLTAKLYDCIRHRSRSGIPKAHWFHRTKSQGIASAPCNFLDGKTAFKVVHVFPIVSLRRL